MVDIVEIKSAVRSGEITVYQENGLLYMENRDGERIELRAKDSISHREEGNAIELAKGSHQRPALPRKAQSCNGEPCR